MLFFVMSGHYVLIQAAVGRLYGKTHLSTIYAFAGLCGFAPGQFRQSPCGIGGFRRMCMLLGMIAGCQIASSELADDKVSRHLSALRVIFEVLHLASAVIESCSFFCATYLVY